MIRWTSILAGLLLGTCLIRSGQADDVSRQLQVIAQVGAEGRGSAAARAARDQLLSKGIEIAPQLLDSLDTSNIVAANWYRSIFDDLVARELQKPDPQLPWDLFKDFVRQPHRQGKSRRLILELIEKVELEFRKEFLPTQLDDPEFRQDAVEWTLREGDRLRGLKQLDQARGQFRIAFAHARDSQQVLLAARKLQESGESVDPIQHMGFVPRWYLLGPFDAPGTSGFDAKFPPEDRVELDMAYAGKEERSLKWTPYHTLDPLGQVNLIDAIAGVREAVGYAYTVIHSPREQTVQLRCSADDNLTVWLNGQKVLAPRQWLNGTRLDRFSTSVRLRSGSNEVLVKICQGPQHVNPEVPNNWSFQLRFCDSTGASVGCRVELPAK